MTIDNAQAPPLLGYHFCSIHQNEGAPPMIQCTGQLVASEGGMYLANFNFHRGPPYARLVTREEVGTYTLFPSKDALGDFVQAFHQEYGIQASANDDRQPAYPDTGPGVPSDTDTGVTLEGTDADGYIHELRQAPGSAVIDIDEPVQTNVVPMSMSKLAADADQGEDTENPAVA